MVYCEDYALSCIIRSSKQQEISLSGIKYCILVEWVVWTSFTVATSLHHHCLLEVLSSTYGVHWAMFTCNTVFCSVVVILLECPTSSHADAGDSITSPLPKWKNLRKVEVYYMNPIPILLAVRFCGKLDEVVIIDPKHCTVGFHKLWCPGTHRVMLLGGPTTLVQCMLELLYWARKTARVYKMLSLD